MLHQGWFDGFSVTVVLRNKAQLAGNGHTPCQKLKRSGGAPLQRPKGWPVNVHSCVTPLAKDQAICCETRLAMGADRPTEYLKPTLMEH